jgi:hypothetical protein
MKPSVPIDLSHVVVFSDLHLGMRNNSRQHNEWCVQFVDWMIEQAQAKGIKTCLFLGDWSHNRSSVNVVTLNYSLTALRKLSQSFDNVVMILGNHDLYFRDKLDMHSIPYASEFTNVSLITKPTVISHSMFLPWLVADEWKSIPSITQPYLFCHAEISRFKMNAMVELPDHGGLSEKEFVHQKLVFSGHFHKRQRRNNILYIGNAFPHNFADQGDDDRGIMFWRPETEPEFVKWPGAPRYRVFDLSQVLADPAGHINSQTFARINVDADLNYEDGVFLRELFENQLGALDVSLVHNKNLADSYSTDDDSDINFESVDSIVLSHLASIESTSMDRNLLRAIYESI